MTNSESDGNNNKTSNVNVALNDMYNHYFVYPENIDAVCQKPSNQLHIKFTSRFIFDKNNKDMYAKEETIRSIYYRLPNLRLAEFFNIKIIRPDLVAGRKAEIAEIRNTANMILSDVDKVKDVRTKKRMLYYFRCLANATKGCDFSNDIAILVAKAAVKNNLASNEDIDMLNRTKNIVMKAISENKHTNLSK